MTNKAKLLKASAVSERYGCVSDMTLWRWVRDGVIPHPVKINGRNYWREADLDEIDAQRETTPA
jgi:predicted DNA-binding transcriptional regulator AlpA